MNTSPPPADWLIAQVLAHSIVYFARERVYPLDIFAGSPPAPEPTAMQLQAYAQHLPELLQVTSQNILPVEQAMLAASQAISPARAQLEYDIYNQFGPQFAQTGAQIAQQNALAQAASDLAVLQGPGQQLAASAAATQRAADPEYYAARELGLSGLQNLFSQLPTGQGLSGGERAEAERSLAQSNYARGNESPTALSTVESAMQFGQAGAARDAQRQQQIAQAVNTASGFLNPAQGRIDTFQLTTGRPSNNSGEFRLSQPQQAGAQTFNFGSQFLGETGANARQQASAITSGGSLLSQIGQGVDIGNDFCCWIFLTVYGGHLPPHIRLCRNVLGTPRIRSGYRRMSKWLVPLMKSSRLVRTLVEATMTYPMEQYGGWLTNTPGYSTGFVFRPVKRFWFKLWNLIGE